MSNFWMKSAACWLSCSLTVGFGCATTTSNGAPAAGASSVVAAEATPSMPELPPPEGWPPYFAPLLLRDVAGKNEVTGEASSLSLGYLLHRMDMEKVRILRANAATCAVDLRSCEGKVSELTALPSFWSSLEGRTLLIGLGFVAGVGATVGIAVAVGQ